MVWILSYEPPVWKYGLSTPFVSAASGGAIYRDRRILIGESIPETEWEKATRLIIFDREVDYQPDFLRLFGSMILSEKAAEIMLAAGRVHCKFFEVDIVGAPHLFSGNRYYYFHFLDPISAVCAERSKGLELSELATRTGHIGYQIKKSSSFCCPGIAVSEAEARGLDLWMDTTVILGVQFYVSDRLKQAWDAAGCQRIYYRACDELESKE